MWLQNKLIYERSAGVNDCTCSLWVLGVWRHVLVWVCFAVQLTVNTIPATALVSSVPVSYTHLTLPTIYSV